MSQTQAPSGNGSSARSSAATPFMPARVAFTSSAASTAAAFQSVQAITASLARTCGCNAAARSAARFSLRLSRRISRAPSESSASTAARAAPPAPKKHRHAVLQEVRPEGVRQARGKPRRIGVAAHEPAVRPEHQKIGRARCDGGLVAIMGDGERRLLVGGGDIDAGKARPLKARHGDGEILRPHGQRHEGAIDPKRVEPKAVQNRGDGMLDGPADHARDFGFAGRVHAGSTPCSRSACNSGSSGRPKIAK